MRNSPTDIIPAIINTLRKGSQTMSKLSKTSKINRVTLSQYIKAFEVSGIIITKKEGRERLIQLRNNPDSYFDLPIKEEDNKTLSTIYHHIRKICKKLYNKEPTKTQVYKILYELKKPLPIGWYQHGPCPVKIYRGNEEILTKLSKEDMKKIQTKVKEYCCMTNKQLQNKIYSKENNKLYLIKEELNNLTNPDKEQLLILTELTKHAPKETLDIVSDFTRTMLLVGWNKQLWEDVWKYISTVSFKESLRWYYEDQVDDYFKDKVDTEEIKKSMSYMVKEYMNSKYSGDKHYEQFARKHQNQNHS